MSEEQNSQLRKYHDAQAETQATADDQNTLAELICRGNAASANSRELIAELDNSIEQARIVGIKTRGSRMKWLRKPK